MAPTYLLTLSSSCARDSDDPRTSITFAGHTPWLVVKVLPVFTTIAARHLLVVAIY
jgi:hypothetical protein